MASWSESCIHCHRAERDRAGEIKHEAWCPLFMRAPESDPYEWPALFGASAEEA